MNTQTLTLTLVQSPGGASGESRQVPSSGMTIGRGAQCDWVLPDPQRSLSRTHCRLEWVDGGWRVRDLSSNGTFVNGDPDPVGQERTRNLHDGDRVRLGDYELTLQLRQPAPTVSPFGAQPAASLFGDPGPGLGFAGVRLPGLDDPLPAARAPWQPPPAVHDHSPATSDAFMPPAVMPAPAASASPAGSSQAVPDDWFRSALIGKPSATSRAVPAPEEPFGHPQGPSAASAPPLAPSPPSARAAQAPVPAFGVPPTDWMPSIEPSREAAPAPAPPPVAVQPVASPPMAHFGAEVAPRAQPPLSATPSATVAPAAASPQPGSGSSLSSLALLMEAAGLPPDTAQRATADPDAALRQAGAVLLAAVAGLRSLLVARGLVKREFRIEQTMLRPKDNNPLKFAASDELALASLMDPRMKGLEAVEQAIGDLTEHEVAVLRATQAAARAMLESLSPTLLEQEDAGGGLLPGATEKRLWQAYQRRHAKLLAQLEDDFESAFGTAFARAYEQAVRGKGSRS